MNYFSSDEDWFLIVGAMVFNATFNNISVISVDPEKNTNLLQVTENFIHCMLYSSL
jgi:hypothetical protein